MEERQAVTKTVLYNGNSYNGLVPSTRCDTTPSSPPVTAHASDSALAVDYVHVINASIALYCEYHVQLRAVVND